MHSTNVSEQYYHFQCLIRGRTQGKIINQFFMSKSTKRRKEIVISWSWQIGKYFKLLLLVQQPNWCKWNFIRTFISHCIHFSDLKIKTIIIWLYDQSVANSISSCKFIINCVFYLNDEKDVCVWRKTLFLKQQTQLR